MLQCIAEERRECVILHTEYVCRSKKKKRGEGVVFYGRMERMCHTDKKVYDIEKEERSYYSL